MFTGIFAIIATLSAKRCTPLNVNVSFAIELIKQAVK
jgi:hypothetical protein